MRIAFGCLLVSVLLLQACSSVPNTTRYYLLSNYQAFDEPGAEARLGVQAAKKRQVRVSLSLAEYLNQPSLVMQVKEHQIHYSLFHVWAEPLLLGATKSLLQDLNTQGSALSFVEAQTARGEPLAHLAVQIDYFHATSDSRVILSGQYHFAEEEGAEILFAEPFTFEQNLRADGYEPSIVQMRHLVSNLARDLVSRLEAESL